MFISIICAAVVHYFNWGLVTGNFFAPDDMTIGLLFFADVVFSLIFIFIGMGIYATINAFENHK